jgi:hypothetical protein
MWTWGAWNDPQPVMANVSPSATFVRGTLCVRDPAGAVSCPFFADVSTTMTYPNAFEAPARDVSIVSNNAAFIGATEFAADLCVVSASSKLVCRFGGQIPPLVDDVGPGFVMAAVGLGVACGLGEDGTVSCAGIATDWSAPSGVTMGPWGGAEEWAAALGAERAVEIVSMETIPCVLTDGRAVVCHRGEIGFECSEGFPACMNGFTPPVAALTAGRRHACAIVKDGDVMCSGQWGGSRMGTTLLGEPTKIAGLPHPAVALASADHADCAILDDTSVWCWGEYSEGGRGARHPWDLGDFEPNPVETCE